MALRIYDIDRKSWNKTFKVCLDSKIDFNASIRREIIKWINDNLNGEWKYPKLGVFSFKDSEDATAFKLRWL